MVIIKLVGDKGHSNENLKPWEYYIIVILNGTWYSKSCTHVRHVTLTYS